MRLSGARNKRAAMRGRALEKAHPELKEYKNIHASILMGGLFGGGVIGFYASRQVDKAAIAAIFGFAIAVGIVQLHIRSIVKKGEENEK